MLIRIEIALNAVSCPKSNECNYILSCAIHNLIHTIVETCLAGFE